MEQAKEMARLAFEALDEKKGEDIQVIDITGISVMADYFLIATGNSDSQVRALVENVEEVLHKAGYPLKQREGYQSGSWVLLDFGDVRGLGLEIVGIDVRGIKNRGDLDIIAADFLREGAPLIDGCHHKDWTLRVRS